MSSNFDFLRGTKKLQEIAQAAMDAEKAYQISPGACCLLSRRAADYALHWMVDNIPKLRESYAQERGMNLDISRDDMLPMLNSFAFRSFIGIKARDELHTIRIFGNRAAHHYDAKIERKDAVTGLTHLQFFLAELNSKYNDGKVVPNLSFDRSLLFSKAQKVESKGNIVKVQAVSRKNESLEFHVHMTFTNAVATLSKADKESVEKLVRQMMKTRRLSPGYEPIPDSECEDLFLVPADRRFRLYIVVFWHGTVCVLLHVAGRKEAVHWGRTKKCEINTSANEFQMFDAALPGSNRIAPQDDPVQTNLLELSKHEGEFIFRDYDAEELLKLGVPLEYVPELYDVTAETWPKMETRLPKEAYDCLTLVLSGTPVDRVRKETYGRNKEVGSEDLEIAVNNPQACMVRVDNEDEIIKMLNAPLEKWRVFLHPQQRHLAYRHYAGAARVLGGAGTGKTVVAIHHAKYLASDSMPGYRILLTTFTRGLASDLKSRLQSICSEEELRKITVINLDKLVSDMVKSWKGRYKSLKYNEDELRSVWEKAISISDVEIDMEYNAGFFMDEWVNVVQAQDIGRLEDYLSAARQGRGRRLDRETRKKLWTVFRNYSSIMAAEGWLDSDAAANYCTHQLQNDPSLMHFDSVIVDESPDFGPAQFRLLRALSGDSHEDDMYITGDPRQQIYTNKPNLILSRCNINVRGRSSQLILNYRTTGNILKWANRLLQNISFDDLDGGTEDMEQTISTVEGELPKLQCFDTQWQEMNYVKGKISELISRGVSPDEIAIIGKFNKILNDAQSSLAESGIPATILKDDTRPKGISLVTMHKSKGLEYSYVFIIGVNKGVIPYKRSLDAAIDEEARTRFVNAEKQLLHVALTRARKNVFVTCSGARSEFLELLEHE